MRIAKIQFHAAEKLYDFNAGTLELKCGDRVIVETDRGRSMAIVATAPVDIPDEAVPANIKTITRLASTVDMEAAARNRSREKETHVFCQNKIAERNLEMKLVKVEYAFDGSKAVFYFTADGRIDFRDLVKDLAQQFHTRIEMRQIGVRDEAKVVGGLGICGRELCCSVFLRDFAPVSVKMAKEQNLALNPTKISGQCGRLLCCLGYEYETYCELRKGLPKCGKHHKCRDVEGEVVKVNTLARTFTIRTQGSGEVVCSADDTGADTPQNQPQTTSPENQPEKPQQQQRSQQRPQRQQQQRPQQPKQQQRPQQKPQQKPQQEPKQELKQEVRTEPVENSEKQEKSGSTGRRRQRNRNRHKNKTDSTKETP